MAPLKLSLQQLVKEVGEAEEDNPMELDEGDLLAQLGQLEVGRQSEPVAVDCTPDTLASP